MYIWPRLFCACHGNPSEAETTAQFEKNTLSRIETLYMLQKDRDRIWNGRHMNVSIIMNQSQSIGISARGRALGFGHALGPGALGPGLGPGRRRLCAGPAAAWAKAWEYA